MVLVVVSDLLIVLTHRDSMLSQRIESLQHSILEADSVDDSNPELTALNEQMAALKAREKVAFFVFVVGSFSEQFGL